MKKRILSIFLLVTLIMSESTLAFAAEPKEVRVDAKSAVLLESSSGTVLLANNMHEPLPPASVTKVMTILLTYDALSEGKLKETDLISISEHAASMGGSQVFLEPGETQTVAELLKCVIIASANDAAVALGEAIAGSEESFVAEMNKKAKALKMDDTTFMNACGLDADGHVTSAYDIAIMTRELITKYPQVFEISKIWQDTITHVTKRGSSEFGLTNTNKLLKLYQSATGLKTGSTGAALFCLSATAERDDMTLIAVVMGAPTSKIRFEEAVKLLDNGFANYAVIKGDTKGTKKGDVTVFKGDKETVAALTKDDFKALVPKGETGELSQDVKLIQVAVAPIEKGAPLGEIVYMYNGNIVGKSELVAEEGVNKLNLFGTMRKLGARWGR